MQKPNISVGKGTDASNFIKKKNKNKKTGEISKKPQLSTTKGRNDQPTDQPTVIDS